MEHIIHSSVLTHLENTNILSDEQHGFCKRRSCDTQLVLTIHELSKALDSGDQIDGILLDFSKAFDKVPHNRLLMKLDHYGVRNNMDSGFLVRPYPNCCTGRKFVINKSFCIWSSTRNGLRPLLFLVYINDMPGYARSQTSLFADDCLVYRKVSSTSDSTQLQEDLDNLIKWEQQCRCSSTQTNVKY